MRLDSLLPVLLFPFKSLLLLALLLVALVAFSLRPNVVLGTDGGSLARSLNGGGALGGIPSKDCRKTDPGSAAWRCTFWQRGGSEGRDTG